MGKRRRTSARPLIEREMAVVVAVVWIVSVLRVVVAVVHREYLGAEVAIASLYVVVTVVLVVARALELRRR